MQLSRLLLLAGIAVGVCFAASPAEALVFHWRGVDVVWTGETRYNNQGQPYFVAGWVETGYPSSASDQAVFEAGGTCSVNINPTIASVLMNHPSAVLYSSGRTFTLSGAMTVTQGLVHLVNTTVNAGGGLMNAANVQSHGATTVNNLVNSGDLRYGGSGAYGHSNLTATLVNSGLVRAESFDGGYDSNFGGQFSNQAAGQYQFRATGGGSRYFSGTLNNQGTVSSEAVNVYFNGTLNNGGSVNVGGYMLMHGAGNTLNQSAGAISVAGAGALDLAGTSVSLLHGSLSDRIYLRNGAVSLLPGSSITGLFRVRGGSSLTGRINSDLTVKAEGTGSVSHANLSLINASNAGTLLMETLDGGYDTNFSGDLLNDTSGTLAFLAGGGGTRNVTSNLTNKGSVLVQGVGTNLSGSLTNTGTVQVGPAGYLRLHGSLFTMNGGTLNSDSEFWGYGGSFVLNSGTVTGNAGLHHGAVTIASPFKGPIRVMGSSTLSGSIGSLAEIKEQGSGWIGHANLVLNNVSNFGKLTMAATDGGYDANATGTLTNQTGGIVSMIVDGGGMRRVYGTVSNAGTISVVGAPTSHRGTWTNTGTFSVSGGGYAHFDSDPTFNQNAGSINAGTGSDFWMYGGTLNLNGGTLVGRVGIHNGKVTLASSVTGKLQTHGTIDLSGTVGTGFEYRSGGSGWVSTSTTAMANVINHGKVTLETYDGGYDTQMTGAMTNASDGVWSMPKGGGGTRRATGTFANQGQLTIEDVRAEFRGTLTNTGAIDVLGTGYVEFFDTPTFNMNSGTLTTDNHFWLHGGTINLQTGTMQGRVGIDNGSVVFKPSSTIQGTVVAVASSNVTGKINSGATVKAGGSGTFAHANLTMNDVQNAGEVRLETESGGYDSNMLGKVTNLPGGSIKCLRAGGGTRWIPAEILNQGSMLVEKDLATYLQGKVVQTGSLITPGATYIHGSNAEFTLQSGTVDAPGALWGFGRPLKLLGGAMSGNVGLDHGSIEFGANSSTVGTVYARGNVALTGKTSQGIVIDAGGAGWVAHGNLACTNLQLAGKMILKTVAGGYDSNLAGTISILPTGRLMTEPGGGGTRFVSIAMQNQGLVSIGSYTQLLGGASGHINQGTFRVIDGKEVYVAGTSFDNDLGSRLEGHGTIRMASAAIDNSGTIDPGNSEIPDSFGNLVVVGHVANSADSQLAFQVGGIAAGQFDKVQVTGNMNLSGSLSVYPSGYVPKVGDAWAVVQVDGTMTGNFTSLPNPEYWSVTKSAHQVVVTRIKRLLGDIDGDDAVTVFDYALLSDAFDSVEGDPNWNSNADLDEDGAVTVFDYAILSDHFDEAV